MLNSHTNLVKIFMKLLAVTEVSTLYPPPPPHNFSAAFDTTSFPFAFNLKVMMDDQLSSCNLVGFKVHVASQASALADFNLSSICHGLITGLALVKRSSWAVSSLNFNVFFCVLQKSGPTILDQYSVYCHTFLTCGLTFKKPLEQ